MLRRVGAGACGTVWAASEQGIAFKREDRGPAQSLRNDFDRRQQIPQSLQRLENFLSKHLRDLWIQSLSLLWLYNEGGSRMVADESTEFSCRLQATQSHHISAICALYRGY